MDKFGFTICLPSTLLSALLASLPLGCGHIAEIDVQPEDSDGEADTETAFDTDSESDTVDPVDYSCPVDVSLPCPDVNHFPGTYDSMLAPGNLQGHTLVNGSPSLNVALGVAPNNGGPRMLIVQYDGTGPELLFIAPSGEDSAALEPRDVVTLPDQECRDNEMGIPRAVLGCAAVALLCGTEACHLYCLDTDDDGLIQRLAPIEGSQVPIRDPVAIAGTRRFPETAGGYDLVYVAGDGISAFDGQAWREHVAPGHGHFADIASGVENQKTPYVGAAGEKGVLYTDLGDAWHPVETGVDRDLTSISALDNKWGTTGGALAASGAAAIVLVSDGTVKTCAYPGETISHVFVRAHYGDEMAPDVAVTAYTENGQVVEAWPGISGDALNACVSDSTFEGRALFAASTPMGADAYFSFLATTDDIYSRIELGIGP